jgi:hypothetical protein
MNYEYSFATPNADGSYSPVSGFRTATPLPHLEIGRRVKTGETEAEIRSYVVTDLIVYLQGDEQNEMHVMVVVQAVY